MLDTGKPKMKTIGKGNKKIMVEMLNWIRSPRSPRSTGDSPHSTPSSSPQTTPREGGVDGIVPDSPRTPRTPRTPTSRNSVSVPCTPTFSLPSDFLPSHGPFPPSPRIKKCVSMDELESIKLIGVGSSSKVYLVRELDSGVVPYTALKVISKEECAATPEDKILEQLRHPLIVQPLSYFEDSTNWYIHMPYVAGGELFYHIRKYKTFNERIAQFYIAEIVLALEHIHSKNICYRDLKPENILLSKEGHIQLIDFGAAQFVKDVKNLHLAVGTLEYLAPEVIKMKKHEKEADWWALGIILYEMLTGKLPFTSPLNSEIPILVLAGKYDIPSHLSDNARSLIKGLLTKKTSKRLGSGKKGVENIKQHPFFAGVNWDSLLQTTPPICIELTDEGDTKYFEYSLE